MKHLGQHGSTPGDEGESPLNRASTWFAIFVAAAVGALVLWRTFLAPAPVTHAEAPASAVTALPSATNVAPPKPPRCTSSGADALVIGDARAKTQGGDANDGGAEEVASDDQLAP